MILDPNPFNRPLHRTLVKKNFWVAMICGLLIFIILVVSAVIAVIFFSGKKTSGDVSAAMPESALLSMLRKSQTIMRAGIEYERAYTQYATIGDIGFEVRDPVSQQWAVDGQMLDMSVFRKLIFNVPVSVSRAGAYMVLLEYSDTNVSLRKQVAQNFAPGVNTVSVEFLSPEWRGYVSPQTVHGSVLVSLDYLVSEKELLDRLKSGDVFDSGMLQRFIQDEHLERGGNPHRIVNKFVSKKEARF